MPGSTDDGPPRVSVLPDQDKILEWCHALSGAGVTANRIASPDLLGQLTQAAAGKIDTLICSVLDTDPTVRFNAMLAETFTLELASGLEILAKLTGVKSVWITADPDRASIWYSTIAERVSHPKLRLIPLRGDYPQTDPSLMLYTLLNRRLPPGELPTEKNALLIDAAAAVRVGQFISHEPPVANIQLAVRDHFQQKTHFLIAPMGVRVDQLCDFLQIHHMDTVFRAGDFLRDLWIGRDAKVGDGELVIHPTARHLDANPDPCIHCGWCLEACPMRIHPAGLLDAAQTGNKKAGQKFGLAACIECGICSYVCPTRLPLLTAIRGLKADTGVR